MINHTSSPHDTNEQAQAERIQRCADLGQIVPRAKALCRTHYEGMLAELNAAAHDVNA